jgi:hypothetical protein
MKLAHTCEGKRESSGREGKSSGREGESSGREGEIERKHIGRAEAHRAGGRHRAEEVRLAAASEAPGGRAAAGGAGGARGRGRGRGQEAEDGAAERAGTRAVRQAELRMDAECASVVAGGRGGAGGGQGRAGDRGQQICQDKDLLIC